MSTEQRPRAYFPNLDGLRTVACLAVFIFHSFVANVPDNAILPRVFMFGTMGVNFFFVLSGFLITYLLLEEEQNSQRTDLIGFYRRRVLRIWPLFYACVAYGFCVLPGIMHLLGVPYHERASLGLHAAFLGNMDSVWQNQQPLSSNLAVLWSVAIEEQFYLVWPILLMFVFRAWRPGAFLLVIAASLWFRYLHSENDFLLYRHSLAVMSDMALGGAAAWVSFSYPAMRRHIAGWSRWAVAGVYLAALGLIAAHKMLPPTAGAIATQRLVRSLLFVVIILEQNYATNSWFKVKNNRFLTYWGKYTYGFYCLHPIVLAWLVFGAERLHLALSHRNILLGAAIGLPISAGLAWLSYTYWEQPFLKLKNGRQPAVTKDATPEAARLADLLLTLPTKTATAHKSKNSLQP